jgi:ATP-dependent RNA helicase DDX10/DBP4
MFLKRHPNDKVVVFLSTCNQVKYMYLAFSKILKKMRIPSMCLTGKMKQFRREEVFITFCRVGPKNQYCEFANSFGVTAFSWLSAIDAVVKNAALHRASPLFSRQ